MIALPIDSLGAMFGRISFAAFVLTLIGPLSKYRRTFLWMFIAIQAASHVALVTTILARCEEHIRITFPSASTNCWRSGLMKIVIYTSGGMPLVTLMVVPSFIKVSIIMQTEHFLAVNATSDLCLTAIGATLILSLQLQSPVKIWLLILLSLSLM